MVLLQKGNKNSRFSLRSSTYFALSGLIKMSQEDLISFLLIFSDLARRYALLKGWLYVLIFHDIPKFGNSFEQVIFKERSCVQYTEDKGKKWKALTA